MGYIIGLIAIVVVVPLLFVLLSRRTHSAGGLAGQSRSRGMTVSEPSSDQATPRADATNQLPSDSAGRLPPG